MDDEERDEQIIRHDERLKTLERIVLSATALILIAFLGGLIKLFFS